MRDALRAGVARVILGTAAYTDVDFLDEVLAAYGERVVVSVDARGGYVTTKGWTETTQMPADAVIERLQRARRQAVRLLERRPRRDARRASTSRRCGGSPRSCAGASSTPAASASLEDLAALVDLRQVNLAGVIVGKALFERRFTVAEGQAVLDGKRCRRGRESPSRARRS